MGTLLQLEVKAGMGGVQRDMSAQRVRSRWTSHADMRVSGLGDENSTVATKAAVRERQNFLIANS